MGTGRIVHALVYSYIYRCYDNHLSGLRLIKSRWFIACISSSTQSAVHILFVDTNNTEHKRDNDVACHNDSLYIYIYEVLQRNKLACVHI